MNRTRTLISVRVFGLSATLGLVASNQALPEVAGAFLLLCTVAALASIPQSTQAARQAVPIVEGAVVALTLSTLGFVEQPLGLYLIVPVLVAGLIGGPVLVASTLGVELAGLTVVPLVRLRPDLLMTTGTHALPWLLTAIGAGLLGSWIHRLIGTPPETDHERYVAAHRLLHDLLAVSRRLSSGLDPVLLSQSLLQDCLVDVGDVPRAVLTRTEGGVFVFLTQPLGGFTRDPTHDRLLLHCWTTAAVAHDTVPSAPPSSPSPATGSSPIADPGSRADIMRWALPLRVGHRTVAVLAFDSTASLDVATVRDLQSLLDDRALPLDSALVFDEVRRLAVVEEGQRLAREIHDGIAQEVASLGYLVDDLEGCPAGQAQPRIERLRRELTRIVDDLRLSIFGLRSQVSRNTGLGLVLG